MLIVSALVLQAAAANDPQGAAIAGRFCGAVASGEEGAAVALLTDTLRAKVATARAIDAKIPRAAGEKPLLGDGLPLTGEPDAIGSCKVAEAGADSARVTYVFDGAPAASWSDRLVLRQRVEDGTSRIADVHYGDSGKGLSAWLDDFIARHRDAAREGK